MKLRYSALTMGIAAAIVLLPAAAMAQAAGGASEAIPYLAIAGIVWYAADKIVDMLPIGESTIVQVIRAALNSFFAKKPQ